MINWNKPIETTDGQVCRVLATDLGTKYPYVVAWKPTKKSEKEGLGTYNEAGEPQSEGFPVLRNPSYKRWFNLYMSKLYPGNLYCGGTYLTREVADKWASSDRVVCIELDEVKGEGL